MNHGEKHPINNFLAQSFTAFYYCEDDSQDRAIWEYAQ